MTKISSMPLRGFGFSQISEIQALFCGLNYVRSLIYIKDQDEIEKVSVEDVDASYVNLKNHGVSSNVAKNHMDLYTE